MMKWAAGLMLALGTVAAAGWWLAHPDLHDRVQLTFPAPEAEANPVHLAPITPAPATQPHPTLVAPTPPASAPARIPSPWGN